MANIIDSIQFTAEEEAEIYLAQLTAEVTRFFGSDTRVLSDAWLEVRKLELTPTATTTTENSWESESEPESLASSPPSLYPQWSSASSMDSSPQSIPILVTRRTERQQERRPQRQQQQQMSVQLRPIEPRDRRTLYVRLNCSLFRVEQVKTFFESLALCLPYQHSVTNINKLKFECFVTFDSHRSAQAVREYIAMLPRPKYPISLADNSMVTVNEIRWPRRK